MIDVNALVNAAINSAVQQAIGDALVPYKETIVHMLKRIEQLEEELTSNSMESRIEHTVDLAVGKYDFERMISSSVESEIDGYNFREVLADLQDPSAVTETSEFRDAVREVIIEAFNR